jgi:hypothetical protein
VKHTFTIVSSDLKFQKALIDFVSEYPRVEDDSTVMHISEGDWLAKHDYLQEIVRRLPLTADGVPVVPGMTLYGGGWGDVGVFMETVRQGGQYTHLYSTAQAAREAATTNQGARQ